MYDWRKHTRKGRAQILPPTKKSDYVPACEREGYDEDKIQKIKSVDKSVDKSDSINNNNNIACG